jgi:hypothetical protein
LREGEQVKWGEKMERKKVRRQKERKKVRATDIKKFPHTKPVHGGDMREAETDSIF